MIRDFLNWIDKKWGELLLCLDRQLVGKSFKQLGVVLLLFLVVLGAITCAYWWFDSDPSKPQSFHRAFVDMTNPETVRKSVYDNRKGFVVVLGYACVYVLGALFFTGLLIATVTNIWRARSDKFRRGAVRYGFYGHIVFLGYNGLIPGMIQRICEEKKNNIKDVRIVVGVEDNASGVCDKIKNRLYEDYRNRIVVLKADSCNRKDLERLCVTSAEKIYIIGEHDDAYNLKCYRTIYELSLCNPSRKTQMPDCYVNLQSRSTFTLFRTNASAGEIGVDFSHFHSFNFLDEWARMLIMKEGIKCDQTTKQIIIAGMTEMGIFLARQAVLLCHYPNTHTILTFVDDEVKVRKKHLVSQYQKLFDYSNILDVEFEFIEGNLDDGFVRNMISGNANDSNRATTLAICYDDSQQNLTMGLYLPDCVYKKNSNVQIWIYQPMSSDLGNYLKSPQYKNVVTFGMSGDVLNFRNKELTDVAKNINHYIQNQNEIQIDYSNEWLIDMEWEELNIFGRWACIRRAAFVPSFLQSNEIHILAELEHKRSIADNLLFGKSPFEDECINNYENYINALKTICPNYF